MQTNRTIGLTNVATQPEVIIRAVGASNVLLRVFDGQNTAELVIPATQASRVSSNLNGVLRAQKMERLIHAELAGTITEAEAKTLATMRENDRKRDEANAQRKAEAEARRAAREAEAAKATKGKANLKAVS